MPKVSTEIQVNNVNGFHVRPSTFIATEALKYKCAITFFKKNDPTPINPKSSMDLLAAFITFKEILTIECDGEDAETALVKMKEVTEAIYDYSHPD